jgi:hypothetical protein
VNGPGFESYQMTRFGNVSSWLGSQLVGHFATQAVDWLTAWLAGWLVSESVRIIPLNAVIWTYFRKRKWAG